MWIKSPFDVVYKSVAYKSMTRCFSVLFQVIFVYLVFHWDATVRKVLSKASGLEKDKGKGG